MLSSSDSSSSSNNDSNNNTTVNSAVDEKSTSKVKMNVKERENYIEQFHFPFCEEASKYEKVAKIGQGTFGEVFKAKDKDNPKKYVAMKKVLMENEKEGFPITALREIKILQLLKHENVVKLIEICRTKASQFNRYRSTFYLVFDFCEHDLAGLLSNMNVKFSLGEIKRVIQQLLNGLYYIHSNKILHRDMKAANILITKNGTLKLADFGLARAFSTTQGVVNRYTNRVVTLWYRPPELLLGERNYGPPVDLWGAGCIMAEMWTRSPIMQGNTEQQQLTLISHLCGSITPESWPGVEKLEYYNKIELPVGQKRKVKDRLKHYVKDAHGCDLLDKLLLLDPSKRIDADTALNHDFFWFDPMPIELSKMLAQHTQSMFEYLVPPRKPGQAKPQPQSQSQPQSQPQQQAATNQLLPVLQVNPASMSPYSMTYFQNLVIPQPATLTVPIQVPLQVPIQIPIPLPLPPSILHCQETVTHHPNPHPAHLAQALPYPPHSSHSHHSNVPQQYQRQLHPQQYPSQSNPSESHCSQSRSQLHYELHSSQHHSSQLHSSQSHCISMPISQPYSSQLHSQPHASQLLSSQSHSYQLRSSHSHSSDTRSSESHSRSRSSQSHSSQPYSSHSHSSQPYSSQSHSSPTHSSHSHSSVAQSSSHHSSQSYSQHHTHTSQSHSSQHRSFQSHSSQQHSGQLRSSRHRSSEQHSSETHSQPYSFRHHSQLQSSHPLSTHSSYSHIVQAQLSTQPQQSYILASSDDPNSSHLLSSTLHSYSSTSLHCHISEFPEHRSQPSSHSHVLHPQYVYPAVYHNASQSTVHQSSSSGTQSSKKSVLASGYQDGTH